MRNSVHVGIIKNFWSGLKTNLGPDSWLTGHGPVLSTTHPSPPATLAALALMFLSESRVLPLPPTACCAFPLPTRLYMR
jgi:hypothetical protein|eukprot:COSAG01_NODE_3734_length_5750_cov_2.251991_4_plen_79_part_00